MALAVLFDQILLQLIQQLFLDDLEAFSSTERRIHALSSGRLAHHRMLNVDTAQRSWQIGVGECITHPIKLLGHIGKIPPSCITSDI